MRLAGHKMAKYDGDKEKKTGGVVEITMEIVVKLSWQKRDKNFFPNLLWVSRVSEHRLVWGSWLVRASLDSEDRGQMTAVFSSMIFSEKCIM